MVIVIVYFTTHYTYCCVCVKHHHTKENSLHARHNKLNSNPESPFWESRFIYRCTDAQKNSTRVRFKNRVVKVIKHDMGLVKMETISGVQIL